MSTLSSAPRRVLLIALVAAIAAAVCVAAVGSTSAGAAAKKSCSSFQTLRTGQNSATAYAPPQIAASTGFLKQECVKLDVQFVAGAAVLVAQMQAGRADMALLNPAGIIQAVQSGLQLRIIAPNTGPGDFSFCVGKDSPIRSLKDFEGKSISTTLLGSNTDIAVRVLLARAGVNLNTVKFVQLLAASNVPAIIRGTVDGGQCNEPFLQQSLNDLRVIEKDPMTKVFGKNTPVTYAIVTKQFYDSHKDLVARYQRAYLRAAALVERRPATFRRAVHFFGQIPTSVTDKMNLPAMPRTYAFKQLISQVKSLVRFGAVKESMPEAQLKSLFVPLPGVPGGGLS